MRTVSFNSMSRSCFGWATTKHFGPINGGGRGNSGREFQKKEVEIENGGMLRYIREILYTQRRWRI